MTLVEHAILEQDELEPDSLGASEQTAVTIEIWSHTGSMLACRCIVQHYADTVLRVSFPPDWRALVQALGHDPYDTAVEGYLETLAKMAFRRGGR